MKRAGTNFDVVGLQDHATTLRPVVLQTENEFLETGGTVSGHAGSEAICSMTRRKV